MNATLEKINTGYSFDSVEHLHTLRGKPLTGTSSISNALAKNLVWWAAELAAVECLEAGARIATIREEYELAAKSPDKKKAIDALQIKYPIFKKARFAHFDSKNKAAKKGTDLHSLLEDFVKADMRGKELVLDSKNKIQPFIDWSKENVKKFIASECHTFSERLWIGGIVDCVAELVDGSLAVIDFKSAKSAFPGHFIQTELYAIQLEENGMFNEDGKYNKTLDKSISKLIIVPFGANVVLPEVRNANDWKSGAEAAVTLFRCLGFEDRVKELNK